MRLLNVLAILNLSQIGAHLLNENELKGLKPQYISKIDPTQEKYDIDHLFTVPYKYVEPEIFALYAATDSMMTDKLYLYQVVIFEAPENERLYWLFKNIEMPIADELKSCVKPGMVNIINYHVPYYWEEFSSLGFDIQLSGHTHGGQFYPAVNFADIVFKYNKGLFKNDSGKYLHVTTGVGSMDTPMRWGTDSEIVILKLRKS